MAAQNVQDWQIDKMTQNRFPLNSISFRKVSQGDEKLGYTGECG